MTLRSLLESLEGNPTLVVTESASVSLRDLMFPRSQVPVGIAGPSVVIRCGQIERVTRSVIAEDGWAESIILVPELASEKELPPLVERRSLATSAPTPVNPAATATPVNPKASATAIPPVATKWLLATSGTSGIPKFVSHTLSGLIRTTRRTQAPDGHVRWGLLYDVSRFAGLQVFLQSLLSGATLLAPARDADLDQQVAFLVDHGCTHLSATPTLWRKMLMIPRSKLLDLKQITLGGEIADDRVLGALAVQFPNARITHIFASTEAGVGFSVSDGRAGFPQRYLVNPPNGIGLKVVDGRLHIRNTDVEPSYVGSKTPFGSADGWIDTGDLVELRGDRVLYLGRESGLINVGGNKVYPEEIEAVLIEHPAVAAVRAYAKSNPITGQLVVGDVQMTDPHGDKKAMRQQLHQYATERLEPYKVPAMLRFVDALEINASGKLKRS